MSGIAQSSGKFCSLQSVIRRWVYFITEPLGVDCTEADFKPEILAYPVIIIEC